MAVERDVLWIGQASVRSLLAVLLMKDYVSCFIIPIIVLY